MGLQFDVVVVGSGNGGLTRRCAALKWAPDILVVEKSHLYGGTSAISGGGVDPLQPLRPRGRPRDSIGAAKTYLRQLITPEEVPEYQLDAYLEKRPENGGVSAPAHLPAMSAWPITPTITPTRWRHGRAPLDGTRDVHRR